MLITKQKDIVASSVFKCVCSNKLVINSPHQWNSVEQTSDATDELQYIAVECFSENSFKNIDRSRFNFKWSERKLLNKKNHLKNKNHLNSSSEIEKKKKNTDQQLLK